MAKFRKLVRSSKGFEVLQLLLIIAIACMIAKKVKDMGTSAAGTGQQSVTDVMGSGGTAGGN